MDQKTGNKPQISSRTHTVAEFIRNMGLKKRSYGLTHAYVNPWHAAMDAFICDAKVKPVAAEKRPAKRKIKRVEAQRPVIRL